MDAAEKLKHRVLTEGPLSFHDYMHEALYDAEVGYYTGDCSPVGIKGDYYTSPCFTPLFGEMIALQLEEMWKILGTDRFSIVEFGGGNGTLCRDILSALSRNRKLYENLHYYIIDKKINDDGSNGAFLHEKLSWLPEADLPGDIEGCILTNELIDNLPFHRVVMRDTLKEVYVGYEQGRWCELLYDAGPRVHQYLNDLEILLPYGSCTEVNLDAIDWLHTAGRILKKGFIITIDYGYTKNELLANGGQGTLACYYHHRRSANPYEHIGEQDISADVNFSALKHWGEKYSLDCAGFTSQQFFLQSMGLADYVRRMEKEGKSYNSSHRELLRLSYEFLVKMSARFKVLIQQKSVSPVTLQGLRFPFKIY